MMRDKFISLGNTNQNSSYSRGVCIEGCLLLSIDFIIYTLSLIYVLRKGGYSRYGLSTLIMMIIPLLDYFLAALGRIIESAISRNNSSLSCDKYFDLTWIRQVINFASVATGIVCNIFMLRNVSIAAILNSEGEQHEKNLRKKLKIVTYSYIAVYTLIFIAIQALQSVVFK